LKRPFYTLITVWVFLVLGRILRLDYLQSCLSTAELYQPSSQSIAETNNKASFSWMFLTLGCLIQNCRNQDLCALNLAITLAVWPVRDCGRLPIKLHEKLKRATTLSKPLKPLLAIPRVVCRFF